MYMYMYMYMSINHFIVLKKDMHCTTNDLQYVGWSQQNEFQIRTVQPVDSNMNHLAFNILMATGTKLLL